MLAEQQTKINKRSKQNTQQQRQSFCQEPKQLPSNKKDQLQTQQIRITPRRSFSKKRIMNKNKNMINLTNNKKQAQTKLKIETNSQVNIPIVTSQDQQKGIKEREKIKIINKKIIQLKNGINLSIISESKNQSKIQSPQQNTKNNKYKESLSSQSRNTFQKWTQSRTAPTKRYTQPPSFSLNSICNHSVNPGIQSFCQDESINIINGQNNTINFKDCFLRKCFTMPKSLNVFDQPTQEIFKKNSRDRSKDKNQAAKKIILIQNLFASKGVKLCQNIHKRQTENKPKITKQPSSNIRVKKLLFDICDQ